MGRRNLPPVVRTEARLHSHDAMDTGRGAGEHRPDTGITTDAFLRWRAASADSDRVACAGRCAAGHAHRRDAADPEATPARKQAGDGAPEVAGGRVSFTRRL